MGESVFQKNLKQSFKNKRLNDLSKEEKNNYRLKTIEQLFLELGNKENRFIFYCPDIVIVNHIVKCIYDIAYALHSLNYKVVILHEIKGYKCNWLLKDSQYSKYKDLNVEFVIEKKSKKSKKEKDQYSFKPTDTLIVPDVFQDMLENVKEVTLLQKVVLITSYNGIANLKAGSSYKNLDVNSLIFLEEKLKKDYTELFPEVNNKFYLPLDKLIDITKFNKAIVDTKTIYPVIGISKIGNEKLAQQVTNLFYSKFPNLRIFSFKLVDRNNYEEYVESIKHCCLYFNMDDVLGFRQSLLEVMNMGVPTATFERRELLDDVELYEEVIVAKRDAFSIADFLGNFCSYWLTHANNSMSNHIDLIINKQNINQLDTETLQNIIRPIFEELHQERIKFFASIKKTIEENELNEVTA